MQGNEPLNGDSPYPETLRDDDARKWWDSFMKTHGESGILSNADTESIVDYCNARSEMDACWVEIESDGRTIMDKEGQPSKRHPLYATIKEQEAIVRQFKGKFGMNPTDRAGLDFPTDEEEDDL